MKTPLKTGVNPGAPEDLTVPAPHVVPVVLLLLQIMVSYRSFPIGGI
jgi:hypothetical protein